ncbi:cell cycle control protein cwf15 [Anaeramoeba flamelloides]|uniref:Cell cycle control protein cwf15 n=1 Tax=Anaeramoeba flamelloides TaxID=1746091 RepID=A0AAV7YYI3_9EUKA|nr:cell cycle control protein cwf15 [Anaeramoeba flamelloides]
MVFSLKNIFKIQKEEPNSNKINNKNRGDQTNKIHVIQTSIKSSTRSRNGKNSKSKTSRKDVDLEKLKKIPKISPLIKSTLEFSVLSRGNQVEKRLDFSPFSTIGSEIMSLLSNLSWKCSSRQNELGHQLVELERVCTVRKDESIVFLNTFEKSQQHARFQLFQLRIEIGNLGKLINNTVDRNKEILSLVPNSLNVIKETKKFKRTIFAIESKKQNNSQTTTELKQQEQFDEKEKEKKFNQDLIWKSFIERRLVIQIKTISKEVIQTAVENSIKNITKKWVIKQKKRKERKLRELQQQQQQQSQQNSHQKKRKKQPKQGEKKNRTRKKKTNLVKSKEKKKNLNSKNKRETPKEKNNSQTKTKSKKTQKHRKAHNNKPKQNPDEIISKEEQLRIENEEMKREIELLKKMQERSVNKK